MGEDVAQDLPSTYLPRTRPQPRRVNRPLTNELPAGPADRAPAKDSQSGSGSAVPDPSPNGEVSNLDRFIKHCYLVPSGAKCCRQW